MGNQINIDGVLTEILEVDFDGDTDITSINLDGTEVWVKAPTALQIVEGLDASLDSLATDGSSTGSWIRGTPHGLDEAPRYRQECVNAAGWRYVDSHTETISGFGISEDSPLDLSPNNSVVYVQTGNDSGGSIDTLKINGDAVTAADSHGAYTLSVAIAHTTTSIEDIDDVTATFSGTTGNAPSHVWAFILPGKWDVTYLTNSASGTATMEPGDIFLYNGFASGNGCGTYPSSWSDTMDGTLLIERNVYWYYWSSLGMWANKTEDDISASWTAAATSHEMVRLRHIGV